MTKYLFFAYSFVWLMLIAYVWSLSRRQKRLQSELEELKAKVSRGTPPGPSLS